MGYAKTKKIIETEVSKAMGKFLKEQMGEQAKNVSAQVTGNTIIVRFKGILPPAERVMIKDREGIKLIKELKEKLIEKAKPVLEVMIKNLTTAEAIDIHSSFDAENGERIEIFTLSKDLEKACRT